MKITQVNGKTALGGECRHYWFSVGDGVTLICGHCGKESVMRKR